VILAAILACSLADQVSVTTYRIQPGDQISSQTWPANLLQRIRKTDVDNPTAVNIAVVFRNSRKTIAIKYAGREQQDKDGKKAFVGSFGWVPPVTNWYHDGFFNVTWEGRKSIHYRFRYLGTESGGRGAARFTAEMPAGRLFVDFALLPNDDKLLMHLTFEPLQDAPMKASVFLACYPASYALNEPEKRRRVVLTSKQEFLNPGPKDSKSVGSLSDAEPWLLFYDRHFDIAAGRGSGPCALAYDSSRVKVFARCGNYQAHAIATLVPGVRETSFVLWDFAGITNADAVQYMKNLEIEPRP
jgi:hypothetical protein